MEPGKKGVKQPFFRNPADHFWELTTTGTRVWLEPDFLARTGTRNSGSSLLEPDFKKIIWFRDEQRESCYLEFWLIQTGNNLSRSSQEEKCPRIQYLTKAKGEHDLKLLMNLISYHIYFWVQNQVYIKHFLLKREFPVLVLVWLDPTTKYPVPL